MNLFFVVCTNVCKTDISDNAILIKRDFALRAENAEIDTQLYRFILLDQDHMDTY